MTDGHKQNDDRQGRFNTTDHKISSLINQIYEQLISMRKEDVQLTEQLTSLYDGLCQLRQTLTNPPANSNMDISIIPIRIDSPTSTYYQTKPRSDSEPNMLSDRQRIVTIVEDLQ